MSLLLRMYPGDVCALLIVNVLVQVTVVILAAWFLARLGSRWNAAWRHTIYLVALVCVLASPVLSSVMQATGIALVTLRPSVPTAVPPEPASIPMTHLPESGLIKPPATPQLAASRVHLETENLGQGLRPRNPSPPSFSDILRALAAVALVIWLLGMAVLLARWCYGLHLIAVLRRAARPLDGEAMVELLHQVRRALGADRLPPMATSAGLDRPIMVGLVRPLVILPEDVLRTLREPELADILVHECAHAVCRHHVVGLLQRLAGMLFWPHPLVHLLNRELARAREEVCDNYVLRRGNAPHYVRTLLELSQLLVGVSPKSAALGLFHCHWRLEDRVADLLDRRRRAMIRVNRYATAALTTVFLLPALLIAGIRVVQAEPAAGEKVVSPAALSAPSDQSLPSTSNAVIELQKPVVGQNFVVVPFTTELQRADNWKYGQARLFVLINGMALFKDEDTVLNVAALDYERLYKALEPYTSYGATKGLILEVICPPNPSKPLYISASSAFLGLLNHRGWNTDTDDNNNVIMTHPSSPIDWASVVADLSKAVTEEEIRRESGVGDDLVKVYPICTPLSRFFCGSNENCVVRNMKPLDQLTPDEIQAFPARAKTYIAKLALKQTPRLRFLTHYGDSQSKANRADSLLHHENDSWWKAQGFVVCGGTMWEGGQPYMSPVLFIKVLDSEKGGIVRDVKISVAYPEKSKEFLSKMSPRFTQDNDRWRATNLLHNEDFTLTVQSPGYRPALQKLHLPKGVTKELEVRLQAE